GERADAADDRALGLRLVGPAAGAAPPGHGTARARRPGPPAPPPAARAVRRRDAARGHRPRPGQRATRPPGRRADRQPRRRERGRDRAALARLEPPGGSNYHHGDAQPRPRRRDRPHRASRRRSGGREGSSAATGRPGLELTRTMTKVYINGKLYD